MWTRREYLKATLAGGAALGLGLPLGRAAERQPDVILRITAKPDVVPIWKGEPTSVLRFKGEVMSGRQDTLRPSDSYLGPIIRVRKGQRVRINFDNGLDEASNIHWHGLHVPDDMDGHPMHIHGLQFQILERSVKPAFAEAVNSVSAGYVNEGWKDEVFLMPGERAQVLLGFKDCGGLFPYHCHMLEHAETGLMRNYLVRA